jgi:hypothetical protein
MKNPNRKLSRRGFLLAVGAGGATATVALVAKQPDTAKKTAGAVSTGKGYQLTEHVQKYYRSAKV